jgi:hypothetical protein
MCVAAGNLKKNLEMPLEEAFRKGIEKGKKIQAVEISKNLLAEGVSPEVILRVLCQSFEEARLIVK